MCKVAIAQPMLGNWIDSPSEMGSIFEESSPFVVVTYSSLDCPSLSCTHLPHYYLPTVGVTFLYRRTHMKKIDNGYGVIFIYPTTIRINVKLMS